MKTHIGRNAGKDRLERLVRCERVFSQISYSRLEIKGTFGISGPQTVGGAGCAPKWVGDALQNEKIIAVAYVTENGGAVYQRVRTWKPFQANEPISCPCNRESGNRRAQSRI